MYVCITILQLTLRTLNDAKTAFACTVFRSEEAGGSSSNSRNNNDHQGGIISPTTSTSRRTTHATTHGSPNIEINESYPGVPLLQDYELVNEPFLAKLQLKVSTYI